MTRYIKDTEHYNCVLSRCTGVQQTLWIGTADIKDLHVKTGMSTVPFLEVLSTLARRGVSIRILHAKQPGVRFMNDFRRYPTLRNIEMTLCPRVHFKILSFDNREVYFGSANLTGAALGMKSSGNRNFEAGILTTEPELVEQTIEHFDSVWRGSHCPKCTRRRYCTKPIK